MQHTYIALDLETTGLSATKDRILEIGAVMVENGEVTGTYETFVDNGVEIPKRIRSRAPFIWGTTDSSMSKAGQTA